MTKLPEGEREAGLALAASMLEAWPDDAAWHYERGLMLTAARAAAEAWGDEALGRRADELVAASIGPDGSIAGYKIAEFNLDQVNPGNYLFGLLGRSGDARYRTAIETLRQQLRVQPRTPSGGYWHKAIYPDQMWLDGLYMAQPFMTRYAVEFEEGAERERDLDDVARQFSIIETRARDPRSGLLRHAWDEGRRQLWADPETGASPHVWGRAVGWFSMALVDCLELFPDGHAGKGALAASLGRLAAAVLRYQDPETGLWYQVLDQGWRKRNYLEASASSMFAYSLAKGLRLGFLGESDAGAAADRAYGGVYERFFSVDAEGRAHLDGTCAVAGLGGEPYRDGSFEYYIGEPVKRDDCKGSGPFVLASIEADLRKRGI